MFLGRQASGLDSDREGEFYGGYQQRQETQTDKLFLFGRFQRAATGIPGRCYEEVRKRIPESC